MPAPKTSTGFVGLEDYLNANRPAVDSTVNGLVNTDTQAAQQGQSDADRGAMGVYNQAKTQGAGNSFDPTATAGFTGAQSELANASQQLRGLGTPGGDAQQIQAKYGKAYATPQTIGAAGSQGLDSALVGAGGQGAFGAAKARYGGLDSYLDNATTRAMQAGNAAYTPPAAPQPDAAPPAADATKPAKSISGNQVTPTMGDGSGSATGVYKNYVKPMKTPYGVI